MSGGGAAGVQRQAAFDIGSGATKLMVADVDVAVGKVVNILFGKEHPVSFAVAWKQSADGTLSEEVQVQGLEVLRGFCAECEKLGVPQQSRAAVATEVFRKASNGAAYLGRVRDECGIEVEVVTQVEEAELGFQTAVALSGLPETEVLAWDSGGASFQITSREVLGQPLRTYLGHLGTGVVTAALVGEIQGHDFASHPSPNPVSATDVEALAALLKQRLAPPAPWLAGAKVTAIGGPNSMFAVAKESLNMPEYTSRNVADAIADSIGKTDEELAARHCREELREPPSFVVPKLSLLHAVMEHCNIASVSYRLAIGSCPGLLISPGKYP